MTRAALILRPEPGNSATAARAAAAGLAVIRLPLFEVVALPWTPPAGNYDALLLTSANAVRHAGAELAALAHLPVVAVGAGTAAAARAAGLTVAAVGHGDGTAALALAHRHGWRHLLRLAGRERTELAGVIDVEVYASRALSPSAESLRAAAGTVALLHSARAAALFRQLLDRERARVETIDIAAISVGVAAAAGTGWNTVVIADQPSDAALIAATCTLAIDP
ncbi:uroporphyrinogen-III synthase [Sphingomonas dokdonensis]|uniref:Uroporphyrinogen-III synthase n=1 Tax=Sphingomonas dokdonensis TaxID=344880 RepID=A0A245ZF67_9SPHN|nr:uroporphyrinogen-III synthase [Sphingomonas dokdonensis]OWK28396.1 uroporphyrinogen-III synthase [Sphingomonas dokdonensis]